MESDLKPGWFFSPPVGSSISDATLEVVLEHLYRNDDHWSQEAPASEDDYCRENWAPLIYSDEIPNGLRVGAEIYYVDQGRFTIGVRGSQITDWSAADDPETGEQLEVPDEWLVTYPVVSDLWEEYLEVSRQGNLFRYPRAVTVDRNQLAVIVRSLFETFSLFPGVGWITEMEYARKYRKWFFVGSFSDPQKK